MIDTRDPSAETNNLAGAWFTRVVATLAVVGLQRHRSRTPDRPASSAGDTRARIGPRV
jgi:hypothetical protein